MPEDERPAWVHVIFDCVETAVKHHKYLWAKTAIDMVVRAVVDRRQNFSEEQQRRIQEWNAMCKGQKTMRQQEYARTTKTTGMSSYERKEEEWRQAAIATGKSGGDQGGGIDNWMAKQGNN